VGVVHCVKSRVELCMTGTPTETRQGVVTVAPPLMLIEPFPLMEFESDAITHAGRFKGAHCGKDHAPDGRS
jgi:hypothetical protein